MGVKERKWGRVRFVRWISRFSMNFKTVSCVVVFFPCTIKTHNFNSAQPNLGFHTSICATAHSCHAFLFLWCSFHGDAAFMASTCQKTTKENTSRTPFRLKDFYTIYEWIFAMNVMDLHRYTPTALVNCSIFGFAVKFPVSRPCIFSQRALPQLQRSTWMQLVSLCWFPA